MKIRVVFRDDDYIYYTHAKKEFDETGKVVKITGYDSGKPVNEISGRKITDYIPLINIKRLTEEEE